MIVDWIVRIVLGILTAVFSIVPASTVGHEEFTAYQSGSWGILAQANRLLPVTEMLSVIVMLLAVQAVLFLWAAAQWVYEKLPFKAS